MHHGFDWLDWLFPFVNSNNLHVFSAILASSIIIICAIIYKSTLKSVEEEIIPGDKLSLKNIFQATIEGIYSMMEGVLGHDARKHFPLIGTVFIYVFVNNIMGSFPGFSSATANVNTNFAVALTVFAYYNYVGVKEQGAVNYLKHFMGPVWWIAPLLLLIELISHLVRPLTLSVRLYANLTGDHIVLGIFSGLAPVLIPVIFMAFGIFVALVQAFVFTLLSTVYIGLATSHEEHDDHEHGEAAHHA